MVDRETARRAARHLTVRQSALESALGSTPAAAPDGAEVSTAAIPSHQERLAEGPAMRSAIPAVAPRLLANATRTRHGRHDRLPSLRSIRAAGTATSTAAPANAGVIADDTTVEAGSACDPSHWSSAMVSDSTTHIVRMEETTR